MANDLSELKRVIEIDDEQRANLETLAAHLEQYAEERNQDVKFSMDTYFEEVDGTAEFEPVDAWEYRDSICDTVCCALGHGILAGIEPDVGATESWLVYSKQFGGDDLYNWVFSCAWADADNTPIGAAKRIRWVLEGKAVPMFTVVVYDDSHLRAAV